MTFGGLPARWEPEGPARGVGLVLPGRAYPPSAPLLEIARQALLQHRFAVRQVWWDTTTWTADDVADLDGWVRRHAEEALASEDADRVVLVAKSLGTRAASYAAERGLDAVWLTPLLVEPVVAQGIAANAGRQLLVGGLADPLWDSAVARGLAGAGCEVLELPDADHALCLDGDVVGSARLWVEVAEAVDAFLAAT